MPNRKYYKTGKNANYNSNSLKNLKNRPKNIVEHQIKKGAKTNKKGLRGAIKGHKVRPWMAIFIDKFREGKISQDKLADVFIKSAVKGDLRSFIFIVEKMEGKDPQTVTHEVGKTFIDLVREGRNKLVTEGKANEPIEAEYSNQEKNPKDEI